MSWHDVGVLLTGVATTRAWMWASGYRKHPVVVEHLEADTQAYDAWRAAQPEETFR